MNLSESMQLESLRTPIFRKDATVRKTTITAAALARKIKAKNDWLTKNVKSKEFILTTIPINSVALLDRHSIEIKASFDEKPVVVEVNKNKIGKTGKGNFIPSVIVIEGSARHNAARLNGEQTILAWVGAEAAKILQIHADQFGSNELQSRLAEVLREKLVPKKNDGKDIGPYPWIQEVYPYEDYFIYQFQGKLWKQKFTADPKKRTVKFTGDSEQVIQKYVDLDAQTPMDRTIARMAPNGNVAKKVTGGFIYNATSPGSGVGPRINVAPPSKSEVAKKEQK